MAFQVLDIFYNWLPSLQFPWKQKQEKQGKTFLAHGKPDIISGKPWEREAVNTAPIVNCQFLNSKINEAFLVGERLDFFADIY